MGEENQPSKKRAAGRELSRDNPGLDDDEEVGEEDMGTFKKASDEVLATRKIVKVRRQQTSTTPSGPTVNLFAGIRLPAPASAAAPATAPAVAPAAAPTNSPAEAQAAKVKADVDDQGTKGDATKEPEVKIVELEENPAEVDQPDQAVGGIAQNLVEAKPVGAVDAENPDEEAPSEEKQLVDDKAENNHKNENGKTEDGNGTSLNSFQQLSNSQNAFTGFSGTGTGFSSSSFSFGSIQKDGSPSQSPLPSFSFDTSNSGSASTPLFGITGPGLSIGGKTEGDAFSSMKEVPRETGEENEETLFSADSALFEFFDGGWKERGKGEVKVNVLKGETQKARLVMRAKGNLRLILNASLYPDLKLTKMEKKGITFACVNSATEEKKDGLSTFALKFKDGSIVEEFSSVVSLHKGKPASASKTPENPPKATED